MISYTLACADGHQFDAWFQNAAAFDAQQARGLVSCAVCGAADVSKAVMAPAVARTDGARLAVGANLPDEQKLRQMLRAYRQKVVSTAENVGPRFAEEARKMHFDEAPTRGIYGQATREEAKGLVEDGIGFLPLPELPEEHN